MGHPLLLPSLLVFLVPLAIYCWVLASINRRPRPTLVSGLWDCVGMLLAAGGILLVVGPVLVKTLFQRILASIPVEADTEPAFAIVMREWWFGWSLYFALLVVSVALLLWRRRTKTIIYNVDPEMFLHVLDDVLDQLDLVGTRQANRLVITRRASLGDQAEAIIAGDVAAKARLSAPAVYLAPHASGTLLIEVFPSMCNVCLHWHRTAGNLRRALEAQLARGLDGARTFENSAAFWLLGLTGLLFGLIFLAAMMLVLIHYFPPPPRRW